jgi:two-component system chemotaxis sensor kinase CheA
MAAAMGYAASEAAAHAAEHALAAVRASAGAPELWAADDVVRLVDALEGAVDEDVAAPAGAGDALAPPAPCAEPTAAPPAAPAPAPAVRVDAARLDALLDLAGDLAAARGRLAAAAARSADPALARAVHDVTRLTRAVQAAVVGARLVPLAELFERLPRVVREAARAAGREVAFESAGGDAAVDRGVLDALAEPLTHLLRNAVDHGIEPSAERVARGKPAAGRVRVAAERVAGGVAVTVEDDGRGVDRRAVVAAAGAGGPGGAADAPDSTPDDAALLALLARPGLTTAAAVTRVSGRGVGVDAALARVRALGGSLALDTEAGRGTRFTLRVPLTLAVTPVLLVRAAGAPYALPLAHVRGTREPAPGDAPVPLAELVGASGGGGVPGDVVLLDAPGGRPVPAGVDRVDGQAECVVKPLPRLRGAFRTAVGATILDGGEVALVLDVPALLARLPAPARP